MKTRHLICLAALCALPLAAATLVTNPVFYPVPSSITTPNVTYTGNVTVNGTFTNASTVYEPTNTAPNALFSGTLTVDGTFTNKSTTYIPTNTAPNVLDSGNLTVTGNFTNGTAMYCPTNSAQFTTVTNELVTGQMTLLRNQRATVTVTVAPTTSGGGLQYSNAVSGLQRTYAAASAVTNTITIRCQPKSHVAVTNAAVIENTTSINYE